jgi:hypothetical protein
MSVYQQCKKWHMKLTELDDVVSGLPLADADKAELNDKIQFIQKKLAGLVNGEVQRTDGKVTHKEKRQKVIALAIVNPTLSMSAIARHFGYSEAFVAKVCGEHGNEINEAQRGNR